MNQRTTMLNFGDRIGRPEWGRALYHLLRIHYLEAHAEEDPLDWEEQADQTVRAIPVAIPWPEIEP